MISSGPSTAPAHAAPTLNATNVDVSPEKGFFRAVWDKVVDVYTSTFKADERIDRLQKMPGHQKEIAHAVNDWREYSNNLDQSIRANVKTVSDVIGSIVERSGQTFATAMDTLNEAYKEITGYTAAQLTHELRRDLSLDQRVKLVDVYNKMKTELSGGKTPYNETAHVVNGISAAITDLVDVDTKQREALKVYDKSVADDLVQGIITPTMANFKKESSFKSTNLLDPALQAIAPELDQKLEALYSTSRTKAFADLAISEGVTTSSLDKIKEAISAAKSSLEGIGSFVQDVVTRASETAEHFKKNQAVRDDILSGIAPADPDKKVAYVSQNTLDALKTWFNGKSTVAETAISGTFSSATTQEGVAAWADQAKSFGVTSEQYRETLKSVGAALTPFTPLIDDKTAPKVFKFTVNKVSAMFEATAVSLVEKFPHDEAMRKLEELRVLSGKVAERAKEDLASGGTLTKDERKLLLADVNIALETIKKGATKSWTH